MLARVDASPAFKDYLDRVGLSLDDDGVALALHRDYLVPPGGHGEFRFPAWAKHSDNHPDEYDRMCPTYRNSLTKQMRDGGAFRHEKLDRAVQTFTNQAAADGDNLYFSLNLQDTTSKRRKQEFLSLGRFALVDIDLPGRALPHLEALELAGIVPTVLVITGTEPDFRIHLWIPLEENTPDIVKLRELQLWLAGIVEKEGEERYETFADRGATKALNLARIPGAMIFPTYDKISNRGYEEAAVALAYVRPVQPYGYDDLVDRARLLFPDDLTIADLGTNSIGDGPAFEEGEFGDVETIGASREIVERFVSANLRALEECGDGERFQMLQKKVPATACAIGYGTHTAEELYQRFMDAIPTFGAKKLSADEQYQFGDAVAEGLRKFASMRSEVVDDMLGLFTFDAVTLEDSDAPSDPGVIANINSDMSALSRKKSAGGHDVASAFREVGERWNRYISEGRLDPSWAANFLLQTAQDLELADEKTRFGRLGVRNAERLILGALDVTEVE